MRESERGCERERERGDKQKDRNAYQGREEDIYQIFKRRKNSGTLDWGLEREREREREGNKHIEWREIVEKERKRTKKESEEELSELLNKEDDG